MGMGEGDGARPGTQKYLMKGIFATGAFAWRAEDDVPRLRLVAHAICE